MGENSEFKRSLLTHLSHHGIHEDNISDFNILDGYLSPIRAQKNTNGCLFVSTAACLEMTLRTLHIKVPCWDKIYFLDVHDAMDRLFQIYPATNDRGTILMKDMISFVTNYGFKVTSLCKQPRAIDELANFDDEALRCRIHGFSILDGNEVLKHLETFPIIAGVIPYVSMFTCTQAVYGGPTVDEKRAKGDIQDGHAVLVIGSMKLYSNSESQTYLIVQNSWGKTHGFSGYVILPFDCCDIFTIFLRLQIDPEKFPYRKMENGTTQFVERHRRKRGSFKEEETSRPSRGDDIMDLDL